MEPEMIHKDIITLLGLQERFTPDNEDHEGIWKQFMKYHDQIQAFSVDGAYYGANFGAKEGKAIDYLAAMAVAGVQNIPEGLTLREVPASRYAVFKCTVKTIGETYDWIFGQWLKTASYPRPGLDSPKADFERYPPATNSGDNPVLLHIALEDDPKEE
ncbi:MAG: GyrI-like domain-containing protein [Anaerolineae bacterium]|nr:GyrI-like domain-containing protein [Anaerolineae bacterium]